MFCPLKIGAFLEVCIDSVRLKVAYDVQPPCAGPPSTKKLEQSSTIAGHMNQ